jgi:DNA-binding protein Alba
MSDEIKEKLDNCIFVGKKSMRAYAEAVEVQFDEKGSKEVYLRTRGKFMVTAINTTEFLKRKSEGKIKVQNITIGSESFIDKEKNREIFVSSLDIKLVKDK